MEFEEMRKIWDAQNNEPLYVINENALHNRIRAKKNQAFHITNVTELLLIIAIFAAGGFVLAMNFFKQSASIFIYVLSGWMFVTAFWVLVSRIRRIKLDNRFDRSMFGDLGHALSTATYQVRLSQIMRLNIIPVGCLIVVSTLEGAKSLWFSVVILAFFVLIWYASSWEHNFYISKKKELEILQRKFNVEIRDERSVS